MAKIVKFFKVIRNNWKKSTVGSLALLYGVNYGKEQYKYVFKKLLLKFLGQVCHGSLNLQLVFKLKLTEQFIT